MLDFSEYDILEDIQEDAWGMPARELVPKRLMYATLKSGGIVIGCYKNGEIIGYCWGWIGNSDIYGVFVYSHHNAVRKEFQNQGIGLQLKLKQKEWAQKQGYSLINWTFDPLQSKNCYLNLHKLGVICNTYKRNYWGEMKDVLNKGIDTDRFYCNWYINSEEVNKRIKGRIQDYSSIIGNSEKKAIETLGEDNNLVVKDIELELTSDVITIEIPSNFNELIQSNKQVLIQWRNKTRTVFENYFNKGYKAVDFFVDKEFDFVKCYHILRKE